MAFFCVPDERVDTGGGIVIVPVAKGSLERLVELISNICDGAAVFCNVDKQELPWTLVATGTHATSSYFKDDGVSDGVAGLLDDAELKAEPGDIGIVFGDQGDDKEVSTTSGSSQALAMMTSVSMKWNPWVVRSAAPS